MLMNDDLYKLMITNARNYIENSKSNEQRIDEFTIAKVLSVLLNKKAQDILTDVLDLNVLEE